MKRVEPNRLGPHRVPWRVLMLGLASLAAAAAAQSPQQPTAEDLIGQWSGRFVGPGGGAFEMTVRRDAGGELGGSISTSADAGQSITWFLDSVEVADATVTMIGFEGLGQLELTARGVLEGSSIEGSYLVHAIADGSEVERGTFTGTK